VDRTQGPLSGAAAGGERIYGGEPLHARRRDQRERLARAARAVLAANGYANASIDEIVSRARVSRTTFYRFFAGKEEAMLALLEEATAELTTAFAEAAAAELPERRIRLGVEGIVGTLGSDPEMAQVLLIEAVGATPAVEEARLETRRRFAALLAAEMRRYAGWRDRPPADLELTALALIAGIAEAVADLVARGEAGRWRDLVPPLIGFAMRALTPDQRWLRAAASSGSASSAASADQAKSTAPWPSPSRGS
jgi:AcrR family transcriptional regulator